MRGYTSAGWLSGFWANTGSVANWKNATFVRSLGEAAAPEEVECGPSPDCAFALQLMKNQGKNSVKASEMFSADQGRTWFS